MVPTEQGPYGAVLPDDGSGVWELPLGLLFRSGLALGTNGPPMGHRHVFVYRSGLISFSSVDDPAPIAPTRHVPPVGGQAPDIIGVDAQTQLHLITKTLIKMEWEMRVMKMMIMMVF